MNSSKNSWDGDPSHLLWVDGFNAGIAYHDTPCVPYPVNMNQWEQWDWIAGFGAALRRINLPKSWLI